MSNNEFNFYNSENDGYRGGFGDLVILFNFLFGLPAVKKVAGGWVEHHAQAGYQKKHDQHRGCAGFSFHSAKAFPSIVITIVLYHTPKGSSSPKCQKAEEKTSSARAGRESPAISLGFQGNQAAL